MLDCFVGKEYKYLIYTMKVVVKYFSVVLIFFFLIVGIAYASSSTYLSQAQRYITLVCRNRVGDQTALFCYLFNKVQEQDTAIAGINTKLSPIPSQITDLQNTVASYSSTLSSFDKRISTLENQQSLQPLDFTFFNGSIGTGANSPVVDAKGYSKITFTFHCVNAGISLQVSNDNSTWLEQYSSNSDSCMNGGSVTLTTAGRYYMVSAGAIPSNTGSVDAIAQFSN